MTVKELKEKLAKLPEECDDLPIVVKDPDCRSDYFLGDGLYKADIDVCMTTSYLGTKNKIECLWLTYDFI